MRRVVVLTLLALSVGGVLPSGSAQPLPAALWEDGIVVAADGEAGFLVLECGDEYRYVIVDFAAPIHDFRGRSLLLGDLRGGDFVEYRVEWPEGYRLATALRITPRVDPTRFGAPRPSDAPRREGGPTRRGGRGAGSLGY
jgi:hypothetical protein